MIQFSDRTKLMVVLEDATKLSFWRSSGEPVDDPNSTLRPVPPYLEIQARLEQPKLLERAKSVDLETLSANQLRKLVKLYEEMGVA